jgi:hypothetical protein
MSSDEHLKSLTALNNLIQEVQPVIDRHIEEMDPKLARYLVDNFSKYLRINLQEDLAAKADSQQYSSPFDDLMDDMTPYHDKNNS